MSVLFLPLVLDAHPIISLSLIAIVSILVSVGIALLTERVAYRPLRKAPRLVPLITAIGASFFWQYFFRGLFGSKVISFPQLEVLTGKAVIFGIPILKSHIIVIIAAVLMLFGLYFFIMKTKVGKSIRAVAENKDVAALMGIDVDRAVSITFAMGSAMAGIAGVLFALVFRQVHFFMGFIPGIKAFTAAVLGGIGSVPGAALGGFLLGMFESVGPGLFLEGTAPVASSAISLLRPTPFRSKPGWRCLVRSPRNTACLSPSWGTRTVKSSAPA